MTEPPEAGDQLDYVFEFGEQQPPVVDMDLLQRLIRDMKPLPPPEPVYLTREQLEKVKTVAKPAGPWAPWMPLLSVPVHVVDRVEDSTPYKRWLEKVKAEYAQAPYPEGGADYGSCRRRGGSPT